MKKTCFTVLLSVMMMSFSFGQSNKNVLPQNSQNFIDQHFSSENIKKVEKEDGWFNWDRSEMYEVHFDNGIKLDFNKEGEITEIDSRRNTAIPQEAIPREIRNYVSKNYQNAQIVSWEKDNDEQEVELSNGIDLEFDLQGKFLKED